jgi:hypothetical protein
MEKVNGKAACSCRCDCGSIKTILKSDLVIGKTRSCGCLRKEIATKNGLLNSKHGQTGTRLWTIYQGIKQRCYYAKSIQYLNYGGKGINVCEEWSGANGFMAFKKWSGQNGYGETLTIDRIDNSLGYSPDNCRWVTMKQQQNNRGNNVFIEYMGGKFTISQLADELNIGRETLSNRIKCGWGEDELSLPANLANKDIRRRKHELSTLTR